MRILKVDYHKKARHKSGKYKIPALVQRIWRGVIHPKPVNIQSTSYLDDFILVPKADEARYIKYTKTAREKGYVYWNAEQRQNIRNLEAQGIPRAEAKEIEKARIFREEDAAAAAQNGATSNQQQPMSFGSNSSGDMVYDNFDNDEDYGDDDGSDDSIDGNDNGYERKEIDVRRPEPIQKPTSILKLPRQDAKSALISNKGRSQQQNYPKPSVTLQRNQQSSTTTTAKTKSVRFAAQQTVIEDQEPKRFDNKPDNRNNNFSAANSRNFQFTTQQNATSHQDPKSFNIVPNNINYDNFTAARSRHDHFGLQKNFITHQEPKLFDNERNNINYSTASSRNFRSITQQNVTAHQSNYRKPSGSGLLLHQHTRTADTSRSIHFTPRQNIHQEPSCFDIEADDINYNNFTQEELQRIENMVKRGMIRETAAQMEWERQLAFQRAGF